MAETRSVRVDQILDAALQLFARNGFHQTSMDELVAATGLSKGSLYWYFDSKDDIILAVLERIFDRELYHLEALLEQDSPVADRLRALALLTAEEMASLEGLLPVVFEFYSLAGRREDVRGVLSGYLSRYRDRLSSLIAQGQERRELGPGSNIGIATAIIALFEGLMVLWALDPGTIDWQVDPLRGMDLILQGLAEG